MQTLSDRSIHCIVTSPPYYGEDEPLRDYKTDGQIGFEKTLDIYVERLRPVFREVYRVLRDDGTLFLNLGFTFDGRGNCIDMPHAVRNALIKDGWYFKCPIIWDKPNVMPASPTKRPAINHEMVFLMAKDKTTEYYFDSVAIEEPCSESYLNEKRPAGIIRQRLYPDSKYRDESFGKGSDQFQPKKQDLTGNPTYTGFNERWQQTVNKYGYPRTRTCRTVWRIPPQPRKEKHFATFPDELASRCIKAGTSEKGCCSKCGAPWERIIERENINRDEQPKRESEMEEHPGRTKPSRCNSKAMETIPKKTVGWKPTCDHNEKVIPCTVLDIFGGRGTTGVMAQELGRSSVLIELSPVYVGFIKRNMHLDEQLNTGILDYQFKIVENNIITERKMLV